MHVFTDFLLFDGYRFMFEGLKQRSNHTDLTNAMMSKAFTMWYMTGRTATKTKVS